MKDLASPSSNRKSLTPQDWLVIFLIILVILNVIVYAMIFSGVLSIPIKFS